jgi:hypothetical protein
MAENFRDQINTARRAGYSDDELIGYLKDKDPRVTQALDAGYKPVEILEHLAPKLSTVEDVSRKVGIAARGAAEALAPAAAGATAGFMAGGPVGASVGALAGGLAVPAADILTQGYNRLMDSNVRLPSQVISNLLPGARAETSAERVLQTGAGALGGTSGAVAAGRKISQLAAMPVSAGAAPTVAPSIAAIGQEAAKRPIAQIVTAPLAASTGQTVTELTDNPLAGLAAGIGTSVAAGVRPVKRTVAPTAEELKAQAKANYDILDKSNFQLSNSQFTSYMSGMASKLRSSAGYDPRIMPDVDAALAQLTSKTNAKTVGELNTLRTIVSNAAKSTKPAERKAASQLLDEFDDYVMNAPPSAVIASDKAAIQAWKDARADYAKMKKSEMITDILENADVSQGSKEANIASQLSSLAKNDKKMRFFTPDEQEAIRASAKGGTLQTMLRTIAKFTPMTPAAAIFTAVNPFGLQTAAAGMAAKGIAEARRVQDVNRLANRMRLGKTPDILEGAFANTPVFFTRGAQNMLGPVQQNQNAMTQ